MHTPDYPLVIRVLLEDIQRAHKRINKLEKKLRKTAKLAADAMNQANAARHWTP